MTVPTESTPFDEAVYVQARQARLDNLFRHVAPTSLAGRTVLELGCGTGELGQAFVELGCRVISVDGRAEYVKTLRQRFPDREAHVADLELLEPARFPNVDIVLCFGLLYHIARPTVFVRRIAGVADTIFLETVVADTDEVTYQVVQETGPEQAIHGVGCRPSPGWIEAVMAWIGFDARDISGARANWDGPYRSVFDWLPRNDGAWMRGTAFLRRMYLCRRVGA